ncbi:hypothetical protein BRADI_2g41741v3 [Brachypodium distachyon]|uniref:Uncharacterized protein n=1 Tax=Brachypodium distachyon TaxID=15368 RepID=A0A2K2DD89_BRADI|nr:hypothetical protein BRADI_2g41741v3 [Brachypodium distachyon]
MRAAESTRRCWRMSTRGLACRRQDKSHRRRALGRRPKEYFTVDDRWDLLVSRCSACSQNPSIIPSERNRYYRAKVLIGRD